MKKYWVLILFAFTACIKSQIDEIPIQVEENEFAITVPADFDWSCITSKTIQVNFTKDRQKTTALDNTVVELLDENDVLIDALTILDGSAVFNVRIPDATTGLKLLSMATGEEMNFDAGISLVSFSVHSDVVNASLENANNAGFVVVNTPQKSDMKSASARSSGASNYVIFEDLWPSKGDYDFNDLVVNSYFSWTRDKSNYISAVTVDCSIEFIGAGLELGIGYELFENKGTELYYLGNVITGIEGAVLDNSVRNGIIATSNVKTLSSKQFEFTFTIKEKELKEFVMIPYLFRTKNPKHQVRPYGAPPTQNQDMMMFDTYDDHSPDSWNWNAGTKFKYPLSSEEAFYKSSQNFPWGIEFITTSSFKPCREKISIIKEYPTFKVWAETGGQNDSDWYNNPL